MNVGEKIAKLREIHGMTQAELADIVGVHRNTIANFETGRTDPSVPEVSRIARAIGCELSDLLPDEEPDTKSATCKVCGVFTPVIVNINFKKTPVCNECCLAITKQTVMSLNIKSLEVPFES